LDRLVAERGRPPRFIRCDNGPEPTANALRDWCRFTSAATSYIQLGSPWQNPSVGSFAGRLCDELLAVDAFSTFLEAQVLVEDWRIEYNTVRPHSAIGYLTLTDYAEAWNANHPNSHSGWTNTRGPVTLRRPLRCRIDDRVVGMADGNGPDGKDLSSTLDACWSRSKPPWIPKDAPSAPRPRPLSILQAVRRAVASRMLRRSPIFFPLSASGTLDCHYGDLCRVWPGEPGGLPFLRELRQPAHA
jgi:hypothetical protein